MSFRLNEVGASQLVQSLERGGSLDKVYSIKAETFYKRSTGTGVLIYAYGRTSLRIWA